MYKTQKLYLNAHKIVISTYLLNFNFVVGLTATLTFFLFGIIPNKLVGFAYIKNDLKTVKLAYIDFWGRRKNIELPVSDLVPLSDLPAVPTDPVYLTLRRFSSKQTFKMNLKYGVVLDKKLFNIVFLQDIKK